MSSTAKTQAAEKQVTIADLWSKCSELAATEQKNLDRIAKTMLPILAWHKEPVQVKSRSASEMFRGFKSITLHPGAMVVMVDSRGRSSSSHLASFSARECLAILEGALAQLEKEVADKKRAAQVAPALSIKLAKDQSQQLPDTTIWRLSVSNGGGDCRGLRVSVKLPGGKTKECQPCDVAGGQEVDVDLGLLKEVGMTEGLRMEMKCADVDGRELAGAQSVLPDGRFWTEVALTA